MASMDTPTMTLESEVPTALNTRVTPTLVGDAPAASEKVPPPEEEQQISLGGFRFWMIFVSLMVTVFLSAIELTSVSTALPKIIEELQGTQFVWVGSAFAVGEAAILPLTGGLAEIFGRRPVVLGSLFFFALGSGISGGAKNMNMLIAGRAIQGVGGGGILSLTEIIIADLVPLAQRGTYMGAIAAVWAVASAIGPPIGGVLAEHNWRWLFYLNIPITAIAMVLVAVFMNLKTPQDDFATKMKRMDWIGNVLAIISTTISIVALTWAGVEHPWVSYQVLVPLILGLLGLVAFFVYEANWAPEPVVPWELVSNRTSLMGYLTVFLQGVIACVVIYYLPTYFQGSLGQSPIHSGTSFFGVAVTIAPAALVAGATVTAFKVYRPQHVVGWIFTTVGLGLFTLLGADTPKQNWVGFQIIAGIGIGILYMVPTFPVLAPVSVNQTAHALALFTFVRTYSLTWGITIGGTIIQNELKKRLPQDFLAQFPGGVEISYSIIPTIPTLAEPLKHQVQVAFADSIRIIWFVMLAFCGAGFVTSLVMQEVKMHETTNSEWGMEAAPKKSTDSDVEKAVVSA